MLKINNVKINEVINTNEVKEEKVYTSSKLMMVAAISHSKGGVILKAYKKDDDCVIYRTDCLGMVDFYNKFTNVLIQAKEIKDNNIYINSFTANIISRGSYNSWITNGFTSTNGRNFSNKEIEILQKFKKVIDTSEGIQLTVMNETIDEVRKTEDEFYFNIVRALIKFKQDARNNFNGVICNNKMVITVSTKTEPQINNVSINTPIVINSEIAKDDSIKNIMCDSEFGSIDISQLEEGNIEESYMDLGYIDEELEARSFDERYETNITINIDEEVTKIEEPKEIEEVKVVIEEIENKHDDVPNNEIEELKAMILNLSKRLDKAEDKIDSLEKVLDEKDKEILKLNKELSKSRKATATWQSKCDSLKNKEVTNEVPSSINEVENTNENVVDEKIETNSKNPNSIKNKIKPAPVFGVNKKSNIKNIDFDSLGLEEDFK